MPTTKLVKLVYLVDYSYFEHYGETLTGFQYMWDHHGPNALSHAIKAEAELLAERGMVRILHKPNIYDGVTTEFSMTGGTEVGCLDIGAEMVVSDVLRLYGHYSVSKITAYTKKTRPFKNARQYDRLSFDQSSPVERGEPGDWEAHKSEIDELGATSQEEILAEYGLA
jgi:hypothetical protein